MHSNNNINNNNRNCSYNNSNNKDQQQQQSEHFEAICFTSLTTNNQAVFISAPQSIPPTMRPALRILPSPRSSPPAPQDKACSISGISCICCLPFGLHSSCRGDASAAPAPAADAALHHRVYATLSYVPETHVRRPKELQRDQEQEQQRGSSCLMTSPNTQFLCSQWTLNSHLETHVTFACAALWRKELPPGGALNCGNSHGLMGSKKEPDMQARQSH